MKTKRAYLIKPEHFEIKEDDVECQSNEVLIKTAVCGLCNWELNHWKGLLGTYPQTIGHEWAGTVVEVGANVKNLKVGDKVTGLINGMKCFSEYFAEDEQNCFKLNEDIDVHQALGEPLKCIITVLRATKAEAGDCGVILGCGPMGLWCIQALAGSLSSIIAVDIDNNKLHLAKKFGATHIINPKEVNTEDKINEITNSLMADFVVEGTGIPEMMNSGLDYLKTGRGRLVLMSSHEDVTKNFDFRKATTKSAEIIAAHPSYSLNELDDMRRAVKYINNGKFKMDSIITHKFSLNDINKAFKTLENKPKDYLKGVVEF